MSRDALFDVTAREEPPLRAIGRFAERNDAHSVPSVRAVVAPDSQVAANVAPARLRLQNPSGGMNVFAALRAGVCRPLPVRLQQRAAGAQNADQLGHGLDQHAVANFAFGESAIRSACALLPRGFDQSVAPNRLGPDKLGLNN